MAWWFIGIFALLGGLLLGLSHREPEFYDGAILTGYFYRQ
jgi:hypothetical protein